MLQNDAEAEVERRVNAAIELCALTALRSPTTASRKALPVAWRELAQRRSVR